jgi:uncharacterized protein DUF4232
MSTRRQAPVTAAVAAALASAALAAAALALAGCGSPATPGAAAGPGHAGASAGAGGALASGRAVPAGGTSTGATTGGDIGGAGPGAACAAATVRVRLDTAAAGVAAGTEYVPLEFTNTSAQPCELSGYPAVALATGLTGKQIGAEAAVDRAVPATAVLLKPGGIAHAWLGITDVADLPASRCRPVTAAGFRVVVPGSESASYLAHPVPACKEPAQAGGILIVRPVQPGAARRGTA